jgi:hypothetical protein
MTRRTAAGLLFVLMAAFSGCDDPADATDTCGSGNTDVMCIWEGPVTFERAAVHVDDNAVYVSAILEWQACGAEVYGHKERVFRIDAATGAASMTDLPAGAAPVEGSPDAPLETTLASGVIAKIEFKASDSVTASELPIGELKKPTGETIAIALPTVCESL